MTVSRRQFLKGMGAAAAAVALGGELPAAERAPAARAASRLRFGVQPRPEHTSYADLLTVWQEADGLGFDSAFVFDHFMPIDGRPAGPCFEGWTLLAALVAKTERIRAGVLVTGNTYRYPAVLAKMAATVDHASGGRLILGMGAGWFDAEHEAYGIPFYTAGERARRLVEAVEVVKSLFTRDRTTFLGKYYTLKDAPFEPKAVQKPHPPILIGGMGAKVIQPLAARQADIWHFFPKGLDPQETKQMGEHFDTLCRKAGRDPSLVERAVTLDPELANAPPKEVRARVRALADVGIRHFFVSLSAPYDRKLLRRLAKEVLPDFRRA